MLLFMILTLLWPASQAVNNLSWNETANQDEKENENKNGRLLSLFNIVTFRHEQCISGSHTGTCMTNSECKECGGEGRGTCAAGFGVCCIVSAAACGARMTVNLTYFTNNAANSGECSYQITVPDNVCQVRLDFNKFQLDGPSDNSQPNLGGLCTTDNFSIRRSQSPKSIVLCGNNTGQHLYFDVSSGDVPELLFNINQASISSNWAVLAQYIPCGNSVPGCDQYFTGESGTITSFNYHNPVQSKQLELAGLDYTICVRRERGTCCLRLTPRTDPYGYNINGALCVSDCNTALTCRTEGTDHLLIPQANQDGKDPVSYTRFCGSLLNVFSTATAGHPVVTCSVPFNLHFHSAPSGNSGNTRGFNLNYIQLPCRRY